MHLTNWTLNVKPGNHREKEDPLTVAVWSSSLEYNICTRASLVKTVDQNVGGSPNRDCQLSYSCEHVWCTSQFHYFLHFTPLEKQECKHFRSFHPTFVGKKILLRFKCSSHFHRNLTIHIGPTLHAASWSSFIYCFNDRCTDFQLYTLVWCSSIARGKMG